MSGVLLWLGVSLLGGSGAVARFAVDRFVAERTDRSFPFGILVVNLSGSVLLGLLAGLALEGDARLLAGTAVLGAYTTFSTWMLDSFRLATTGRRAALVANVGVSLALGLVSVALGRALGELL